MDKKMIRVLVALENKVDFKSLWDHFIRIKPFQYELENVQSLAEALAKLRRREHDIYLVEYRLGPDSGLDFLKQAAEDKNSVPVIMLGNAGGGGSDLEAMALGAADYLDLNKLDSDLLERSIRYALERNRDLLALSKEEAFYRALIENAMEIIVVIGMDGKIRYVSPSGHKLMGYMPGENLGRNAFELIHPDDIEPLQKLFRKLIREPDLVLNTEFQMKHKDGTWRIVEGIGKRHTFSNETSPTIVVNYHDVTERRKTEREMERLASIVESSTDAIYLIDLQGSILSWNQGAYLVYGYTAEEVSDRSAHMLLTHGRVGEFEHILASAKKGNPVNNFETIHRRKDGNEILVSMTVSPLAEKNGEITHASVIARHVLEREQADSIRKALQLERDELLNRLQLQMESMPIACILNDKQPRITYMNPAAEKMFGYSLNELKGKSPQGNIIPEFKWPFVENVFKKMAQGEEGSGAIIGEALHKDGHILICEWYNRPLTDAEGHYTGHMTMALDITERKKTEEMLAQFAAVAEYSDDAILGVDLKGNIMSWNKGAEKIYGYRAEEVLGKSSSICQPADQKADYDRFRDLILQGGFISNFETVRMRKNGDRFPATITVSPIHNTKGEIIGASAISRDITERKKAEEMTARFAALAEHSDDAIMGADLQGVITSWNKGAEKLYGYKPEEVIGRKASLLLAKGNEGDFSHLLDKVPKGRVISNDETVRIRKDGQKIDVAITASLVRDPKGNATGLSVIARDITQQKKVREMLARFAAVAEYSDDAIIGVDLKGNITSWNKGAEKVYGYSASEAVGQNASFYIPADYTDDVPRLLAMIERGEAISNYETLRVRKDGKKIDVAITVSPVRNPQGGIGGASIIARDITEHKKGEVAKTLLAAIFENTSDAITGSDMEGNLNIWSPGAEDMYGWRADEVLGRNVSIIAPKGLEWELEDIRRMIARGETLSGFETIRKRKNGESVQVSLTMAPVRDSKGEVVGVSSIARDISEKKKTEEMMAQFAAVAMYSNDAIIGMDLQGIITGWNKGAERIFGYPAEKAVGTNLIDNMPKDQKELNLNFLKMVQKGEVVSDYETFYLNADGQRTEMTVTGSPIRDSKGDVTGVSYIIRDITERKRAGEYLKRQEEQLGLMQRMEIIGRLAGGMAHDFNNLLSVVGGNCDFLLRSLPPGDSRREEVEEIRKAVKRGAEMTKQLLVFGKKQASRPQPLNLNDLSMEMDKMLRRIIDPNINIAIIPGKNLKMIEADAGQIQEVILNLVMNACDAMPRGGNIIIETKNFAPDEMRSHSGLNIPLVPFVRLNVTDTGQGMDLQTQKHLFEPFFTTKRDKGTGLGLASVSDIVKQWKGYIGLHSTPGLGTTFSIFFPAIEGKTEPVAKPKQMALLPMGTETVLLAEDESAIRKVILRVLENQGYRVLEAADGEEAARLAGEYKETIHLLLTDVVMPRKNGKELADQLRKTRPKMKVIFISGYPREILSKRGVLKRDIHLIKKPFEMDELIQRIRKVLDRK